MEFFQCSSWEQVLWKSCERVSVGRRPAWLNQSLYYELSVCLPVYLLLLEWPSRKIFFQRSCPVQYLIEINVPPWNILLKSRKLSWDKSKVAASKKGNIVFIESDFLLPSCPTSIISWLSTETKTIQLATGFAKDILEKENFRFATQAQKVSIEPPYWIHSS